MKLDFGVGTVTVSTQGKFEEWNLKMCELNINLQKRIKHSDYKKKSETLFLWFSQQRT